MPPSTFAKNETISSSNAMTGMIVMPVKPCNDRPVGSLEFLSNTAPPSMSLPTVKNPQAMNIACNTTPIATRPASTR